MIGQALPSRWKYALQLSSVVLSFRIGVLAVNSGLTHEKIVGASDVIAGFIAPAAIDLAAHI